MKKSLLTWLIQVLTMPVVLGQHGELRKNTIAFETGLWNRGVAGISYTRNYCISDHFHLSNDISAGIGSGWQQFHTYYTTSMAANIGNDNHYLILGAEAKYYEFSTGGFLFDSVETYEGISVSPMIGYVCQYAKGFASRTRASVFFIEKEGQPYSSRPSLGFSFGYSF